MKLMRIIMTKGWLIVIPLLFHVAAHGQIRYSNFYDSNMGAELLKEAVVFDNGSLLIAGGTGNSDGSGYVKTFNLVVDEQGDLVHDKVIEFNVGHVNSKAVLQTESGGIYEAGFFCDFSTSSSGPCDFFLSKLDETGDTLFTRIIERPDTNDYLLDIVQTRPNKLLLIGWTYNDTVDVSAAAQLLFITTDTLGNKLNEVVWGGVTQTL